MNNILCEWRVLYKLDKHIAVKLWEAARWMWSKMEYTEFKGTLTKCKKEELQRSTVGVK